jgi:hypothetical protein
VAHGAGSMGDLQPQVETDDKAVDLRILPPGQQLGLPCLYCHRLGTAVEINGVQAATCDRHLSEVGRMIIRGMAPQLESSAA